MYSMVVGKVLKTSCAVILLAALIGCADWQVQSASAQQRAAQSCAALGTYSAGTRLLTVPHSSVSVPIYFYGGMMQGTVTLTSYTGCGASTTGSFAVSVPVRSLPIELPQAGAPGSTPPGTGAVVATPLSTTTVLSATGTFVQDTAHAADPAYVQVSAVLAYGRIPSFACGRICPQPGTGAELPCTPTRCNFGRAVVTRVVTVTAITGFLHWQNSAPSLLGMAFLPPPEPTASDAAALLSIQPIAFVGQRVAGH